MTAGVRDHMSSLFEWTTRWGVALVRITDAKVAQHETERLRVSLLDVSDGHGGRVVLDASGIASFNCTWINTLLALSARCASNGGHLFVTGLSDEATAILRATGLSSKVKTADSTEHALSAMGLTGTSTWRMAIGDFFSRKAA